MTLDFDVWHLPGSLPDWSRLVTALAAATEDAITEKSYLELKGQLDLTGAEHRFKVAKAILGFANRDPDAASPFFGGRALVVIGIHQGQVTGIRRIEDHQLQRALTRYLGPDDKAPRWTVHRHRVDDQNDVVIIIVDAPRPGDPIYTLHRAFENFDPGTVFSRPSTESTPADPAAIEMLSRRLVARDRALKVEVTLGIDDIHRYTWDPAVLDPLLNQEVEHLPAPASSARPTPDPDKRASNALTAAQTRMLPSSLGAFAKQAEELRSLSQISHEETRTEPEFREDVGRWADRFRQTFPEALVDLVASILPPAKFSVINNSGRFLEEVEVELHIDGPVIQHPKPFDADSIWRRLPARPRNWGPWTEKRIDYSSLRSAATFAGNRIAPPPRPNQTSFRNSGSVTAVLRCKELRPGRRHTFTEADDHDDLVLLTANLNLAAIRVQATATARGIDDTCVTEFGQPVAATLDVTEQVKRYLHGLRGLYFHAEKK